MSDRARRRVHERGEVRKNKKNEMLDILNMNDSDDDGEEKCEGRNNIICKKIVLNVALKCSDFM